MNGLVRITTQIGYFVIRAWRTEGIRPGVVGVSHHMGRWRLDDTQGTPRYSSALAALSGPTTAFGRSDHPTGKPGQWHMSQTKGVTPFESADPDCGRVWWSDAGVHQNLTFPVQPDPVSGMHCWLQRVTVAAGACRRSLRRHRRRHRSLDRGVPRVAGQDPSRPRARWAATTAVARSPGQADRIRVRHAAPRLEAKAVTSDLALIAERRGGLAALLGLLLLEEPGPALAPLVAEVPAFAPLASGDPTLATEYERVFLRGVPLYESVFLSDDGQHGDTVLASVVDGYARLGFTEHVDRRWRIAGADHLGLELRCLAHLCHDEAAAWRAGTPDKAMEAIESEREFLAHHMAAWAPVAVQSARERAGRGAYAVLLTAVTEFLTEEFDRLRPAPILDSDSNIDADLVPANLGPARLARVLLAPAMCGAWLSPDVIGTASRGIGAPWRPSDARSTLRHVIEDADESDELALVLEPIIEALDRATAWHNSEVLRSPGNAANARHWAATAEVTRRRLMQIAQLGLRVADQPTISETLTITGVDAGHLSDVIDKLVDDLRGNGLVVKRSS